MVRSGSKKIVKTLKSPCTSISASSAVLAVQGLLRHILPRHSRPTWKRPFSIIYAGLQDSTIHTPRKTRIGPPVCSDHAPTHILPLPPPPPRAPSINEIPVDTTYGRAAELVCGWAEEFQLNGPQTLLIKRTFLGQSKHETRPLIYITKIPEIGLNRNPTQPNRGVSPERKTSTFSFSKMTLRNASLPLSFHLSRSDEAKGEHLNGT